jgi:hypothetical protein
VGTVSRGVVNEVKIAGFVYNNGGIVDVMAGGNLLLTATDAKGYNYWQTGNGTSEELIVGAGGNLAVSGTIEIDAGTLQLTAPSNGFAEELNGNALIFGSTNATFLKIVDEGSGVGKVTVVLDVTLAANTTTEMNFIGGSNATDLLDVHNGTLTLAGDLYLRSINGLKLTQPANFLDDSGSTPNITGNFAAITDNVNGTDTGAQVVNNPQLIYYQVTMK